VPNSFSLADFDIFKKNNIQVALHTPHTNHSFDVFNLNKKNLSIWHDQVLKAADYLNSQFIVTHTGVGESKEIFQKESQKLKDPRVLMENMPYRGFIDLGGVICFGYSKDQLEFIHRECGFDFCFDVCHAVASAASQKIDVYEFISDCIGTLKPSYFHLASGNVDEEIDRHLNIWDGNFDFLWLKKELAQRANQEDIFLVFETPKTGEGLENDVKNIEYFKKL